jgi:spermidine/putrescine ABC transporter ATP-binding subunit
MTTEIGQDLTLEQVSRRFGDVVAVNNIHLHVSAGELVALLGPSGCGKTTTLRIIAGFERPDTGRVLIANRDISRLPPNRRGLGMVFQDYSLFPHMTVGENVAFGLRMAGIKSAEIASRVSEILDLVRLRGYEGRYSTQLSGGQQQRVALARSLVIRPSVLLLDEPLGALDKNLRESMQFELRRIQQALGITAVMVTHDQEEALTLSDRVAVMNGGRILQIGTPNQVYDAPRSRFVSEFLGTSNLFEGSVADVQVEYATVTVGMNGAVYNLRVPRSDRLQTHAPALVAVRPEKITISETEIAKANVAPGTVTGHVFRGTHHAYEIGIPNRDSMIFVYRQAESRGGNRVFGVGDRVFIGWDLEDSIVLDRDSESG